MFFMKFGYLKATLFGLIEWPFFILGICAVITDGSQYPPFRFVTSTFLYPPTTIELISGQYAVLFT